MFLGGGISLEDWYIFWGRAFPTQIGQSIFFVLTILCLGGNGKHAHAFRTQIGLNYFFYSGQFGYGKHGRA
jgi:hypothetical protein